MKITRFAMICAFALGLPLSANADTANNEAMNGVAHLQEEWARIKYQMTDEKQQLDAIHQLETEGESLLNLYPDSPEVMIWQGIVLSTDAGIVRGISALGKVNDARDLFEKSIVLDPTALDGSAYTSLGSLYYQVPPWPLAFGSDSKAEEFLKKALELNPDGIDPNYFYGDFLLQNDHYAEAKVYLEKALNAPERPSRASADAGRRAEIAKALNEIAQEISKN